MNDANFNAEAAQEPVSEATEPKYATAQEALDAFIEHEKKAIEESLKAVDALLPEGFKSHGKEAGKEFAKGLKILVDAAVVAIDSASKEIDRQMKANAQKAETVVEDVGSDRPSTTGANKVKVVVE
jgi:hypothetical protein